jgi:hypothetical protein
MAGKDFPLFLKDSSGGYESVPVQINHQPPEPNIAASMKTPLITTLVLAAASFLTTASFAQSTWETVDDFQYAPGKSTSPFGITATPDGAIFVSAAAIDAANLQHGFVNRSLDGGATWDLVLDLIGKNSANCFTVAAAPSGTLWATSRTNAINAKNKALYATWLTHASTDGGATWVLSDSFRGAGQEAAPFCTAVDAAGRIFVGGQVSDAQNRLHFTIRRSTDNGATWQTVDDLYSSPMSAAWGITTTPTAVVAAGRLGNSWIVRRSLNGGTTWTTVDSSLPSLGFAYGVAADASGNLFAVGFASIVVNKVSQSHWITRRSVNGGTTWTTVDDYYPGATAMARGVGVDAFGRVFVTGTSAGAWTVRGSTDGGATWTTTDTFRLTPTGSANAVGVAGDSSGNVFVAGAVLGADGVNHDVVRKLTTP